MSAVAPPADLIDTALLPSVALTPAPNRRSGRRMAPRTGTTVICRPNAMDVGPSLTVAVLDLSDSGAQLRLQKPLPVGQVAVLTVGGSYVGRSVRRTARVKWCGPQAADGTAACGFAFDDPVRYADLTHFVRM